MANKPAIRGKDSTLKLFIGDKTIPIDVRRWRAAENATEIEDNVCGEDRARLDKVVNFYTVTLELLTSDATLIRELLKDQQNDDAGAIPQEKAVAGLLREKGGKKFAWRMSGVVLGAWDIGADDRASAVNQNVPLRCQYFEEVPVV